MVSTEILNIVLNIKAPITAVCNRCLTEMKESEIATLDDKTLVEDTLAGGRYTITILRCKNKHTVYVLKRHIKFRRKVRSYKYRKPGGTYRVVRVTLPKESKSKRLNKLLIKIVPFLREKKVVSIELSGSEDVKEKSSSEEEE